MGTPAQMFDNRLNVLKAWPSPYALDKSLAIEPSEEGLISGRVMHVDATSGGFKLGLPAANANGMPIFAWVGQNEFDALGGDDLNMSNYGNKKGVMGLVATG